MVVPSWLDVSSDRLSRLGASSPLPTSSPASAGCAGWPDLKEILSIFCRDASAGGGRKDGVGGRTISSVSSFFLDLRTANRKPVANIKQAAATDPAAIPAFAPEENEAVDVLEAVIVELGAEVHVGCVLVVVAVDEEGLSTIGGLRIPCFQFGRTPFSTKAKYHSGTATNQS